MDAGFELNALVAEKVMGLEMAPDTSRYVWNDISGWMRPPPYSTDIAAAWLVVEKMRDQWTQATDGMQLADDFPRPFDDIAFFEVLHRKADRRWPWALLYITPHAICLASLKACGIDIDY